MKGKKYNKTAQVSSSAAMRSSRNIKRSITESMNQGKHHEIAEKSSSAAMGSTRGHERRLQSVRTSPRA